MTITRRGFLKVVPLVMAATATSPLLTAAVNQIVRPRQYWDMGAAWSTHDRAFILKCLRETMERQMSAGLIHDFRANEMFLPVEFEVEVVPAVPADHIVVNVSLKPVMPAMREV